MNKSLVISKSKNKQTWNVFFGGNLLFWSLIYLFLSLLTKVSKQVVKEVPMTKMVVYEAVEIIEGIQRPIVKSPDINGRMRTLMT